MADPGEGVTADGTIRTGVSLAHVPGAFRPVLDAAVEAVQTLSPHAALYVYGSVATGQARRGVSDVDLLTIDLPTGDAARLAAELSDRFGDVCRGVDVATARGEDMIGEHDEGYGGRVFLRHYCAHLCGPDHDRSVRDFPADARAARGFNGDIAEHARRWRTELDAGAALPTVARRMARKTLLAVAGLVSVHDRTWTTDRSLAAARWSVVDPPSRPGLGQLLAWVSVADAVHADRVGVERELDGTVRRVVDQFADRIGLWSA